MRLSLETDKTKVRDKEDGINGVSCIQHHW